MKRWRDKIGGEKRRKSCCAETHHFRCWCTDPQQETLLTPGEKCGWTMPSAERECVTETTGIKGTLRVTPRVHYNKHFLPCLHKHAESFPCKCSSRYECVEVYNSIYIQSVGLCLDRYALKKTQKESCALEQVKQTQRLKAVSHVCTASSGYKKTKKTNVNMKQDMAI